MEIQSTLASLRSSARKPTGSTSFSLPTSFECAQILRSSAEDTSTIFSPHHSEGDNASRWRIHPNHRKQVPQTALYFLDPPGRLRQPSCELRKSVRFELLVKNNDTADLAQSGAERINELAPWVAGVRSKKLVLLGLCSGFSLNMH